MFAVKPIFYPGQLVQVVFSERHGRNGLDDHAIASIHPTMYASLKNEQIGLYIGPGSFPNDWPLNASGRRCEYLVLFEDGYYFVNPEVLKLYTEKIEEAST